MSDRALAFIVEDQSQTRDIRVMQHSFFRRFFGLTCDDETRRRLDEAADRHKRAACELHDRIVRFVKRNEQSQSTGNVDRTR